MGVYSSKVIERCKALRFSDVCYDYVVSSREANFDCGCVVAFSLKVDDESGEISCGFQTNGCGYMTASADILADHVTDRRSADLRGLDSAAMMEVIVCELDPLPEYRRNCADVCISALRGAFADLRSKRIEQFHGERALICTCFGVSVDTIDELIASDSINSTDDIANACNAGSGCGSCRMLIQEILDSL